MSGRKRAKRKWEVSVDLAGPEGDWTVKTYYRRTAHGFQVKRIVKIPPVARRRGEVKGGV